jgi:adenine-specific DNA-methyltransferase
VATVSVLYVSDDHVAPLLELLRNVCEPSSRSRPHVTVRYFDRLSVPAEYKQVRVRHIDLVEAAAFADPELTGLNTVFVRCECDELLPLEHKPHFPASDFHITLYDGSSGEFARKVLSILQTVRWGFRLTLPDASRLTSLKIGKRRPKLDVGVREYAPALVNLFRDLTGEELTSSLLTTCSDRRRFQFMRAICRQLNRVTRSLPRVDPHHPEDPPAALASNAPASDVHLTPPELAEDIARYAVSLMPPDAPIDFGDPAMGTGAFYSALLKVVSAARVRTAFGIEVDPDQAAVASRRWTKRGLQVVRADYFHMDRLQERNLILANPPYLRHHGIPLAYKAARRARASVVGHVRINARAGLYVYFLLLSHHWLASDGIAAWLIPTEFMQTEYGQAVRDYLSSHVELLRIHQFAATSPQFENAKVLPSVVIFRNRLPSKNHSAQLTRGGGLSDPQESELLSVAALAKTDRWLSGARHTVRPIESVTVGDLFVVRRGIATGANAFFIMERTVARAQGIPEIALRPVLPKVKTLLKDVIDRRPDGYPALSPQLVVIDCSLTEEEIARRFARFSEYLASKKTELLQRTLVRERKPWYAQEHRTPSPFVCNYMGRAHQSTPPIRFFWNRSDAIVTNTYLMLYPRPGLARLLVSVATYRGLFAVLQDAAQENMIERLRMHADGLYKIEPRDLLGVRLNLQDWLRPALNARLGELDFGAPA